MSSTIDAAGRLVIPKEIREQLRLTPGTQVEVVVQDGVVVVRPVGSRLRLVKRGKGLVAESEEHLPVLTAAAVREALEAGRR